MSREDCVPKLIGGDVELGNFLIGKAAGAGPSDYEASRLLLAKIDGLPRRWSQPLGNARDMLASLAAGRRRGYGPSLLGGNRSQDWCRKYLRTNGGCIYIDLNHLELATPEVRSARDYEAAWSAMLRIARQAQGAVNAELAPDARVAVLANNSDRQSHSYGGHQSFLVSRRMFDNMVHEQMFPSFFYLCAYQVSSVVFTGQGKVGSENHAPYARFQISQRADFIECLAGEQTTYRRPLINTRDEPLCGPRHGNTGLPGDRYARLHVIFYDTNLAPVATFLKVGVMQLILAMIEAGFIDAGLLLADPLRALRVWSRDPSCTAAMPLLSGRMRTAVELQLEFLEQAQRFAETHGFAGLVPDAELILALWQDTLGKLATGDLESLRGRLDWVMKLALIEQARHSGWGAESPNLVHLDQIYASLDEGDGLFLSVQRAGLVEQVATETEITRFVCDPPEDTRAWIRAMLLRTAGPERIAHVDWDEIELTRAAAHGARTRLRLADPLVARADVERAFVEAPDFASLVESLERSGVVTIREGRVGSRTVSSPFSTPLSYEIN